MSVHYSDGFIGRISRIFSAKKSGYKTTSTRSNSTHDSVLEPLKQASPEVQKVVKRVLQVEKDKLHFSSPRNINDDILKIIKEEVRDA
ncbi:MULTISPECIES: hypothetical protein [unclassified Roseofilum]|uniref:hypothetical protein n=1 Tax=unclassified Roseofilum TaxID=2620099 RepID=UPI000E9F138C|nr:MULTISPECIES: hypothetical protein [unclassified Roseofilum]HBQ98715.1 hypothetical protein [Cyanobacteria bacterium UBA11691]MBP0010344.1 hypothetical protein [Roseofilum sp. Belize Diploria]MBP0011636.1 hypothetical protein [Roseofilum sp. SID3]MBP0025859.1 hypothetical protein [Roseofilum sp. SID2]MBP0032204.1 hypothetical protein [Roseofilum sp. Belize BBD 4]